MNDLLLQLEAAVDAAVRGAQGEFESRFVALYESRGEIDPVAYRGQAIRVLAAALQQLSMASALLDIPPAYAQGFVRQFASLSDEDHGLMVKGACMGAGRFRLHLRSRDAGWRGMLRSFVEMSPEDRHRFMAAVQGGRVDD